MILTANRRQTFSASRRLARDTWSADEAERVYGAGAERAWGSGENYAVHLVFSGVTDAATGMLVNLSDVKAALAPVIERYDHRFLNLDTPPFDRLPPTPENVALQLFDEARRACAGLPARLVACHLAESARTAATAWSDGRVEREYTVEFSAARRTFSPHLSEEENAAYFGPAASPAGHGHGYTLRVVIGGTPDPDTGLVVPHAVARGALDRLHARLDHRNLNLEVAELAGQPMTTECLARFVFDLLAAELPVLRVRLHEMPHFFAEHDGSLTALGLEDTFSAAHRLSRPGLSDDANRLIYGKCSNPNGHGHRYTVQATLAGAIDERTGTVFNLAAFVHALTGALAPWDRRHLDLETPEFGARPSTGENIVQALWPKLDARLEGRLARVRLFETGNNRFALRWEE
jgi:6-pyruvoyltetrahydropterin/6-carboxytetrahydropterin synthase